MFDVHIIDASNASAYSDVLDRYFRVRHDIYVKEFRWPGLTPYDDREIDQFDGDDATYLLGLTAGRQVVAGSRLIPTTKPHLLRDVFPWLADGPVPVGPDTWEWTRIFVAKSLRVPGKPSPAAGRILCAIQEFCATTGISHISVVCEAFWFERLLGLGWRPQHLGRAQDHEGETLVALRLGMTAEALDQTRRFYRISGTVLAPKAIVQDDFRSTRA